MINRKCLTALLAAVIMTAIPATVHADPADSSIGRKTTWDLVLRQTAEEEIAEEPVEEPAEEPASEPVKYEEEVVPAEEYQQEVLKPAHAATPEEIMAEALAGMSLPENAENPETVTAPEEVQEVQEVQNVQEVQEVLEPLAADGEDLDVESDETYKALFKNKSTSSTSTKKNSRIPVTRYAGKDYSLVFDARYYLQHNPDVASLVGDDYELALRHFVLYGMSQRRQAISTFDVNAYYTNYPELHEEFGLDWPSYYMHYQTVGKSKGYVGTGTVKSKTAVKAAREEAERKAREQAEREEAARQAALAAQQAFQQQAIQTQQVSGTTLTANNVRATAFLQEVAKVTEYARVRGMTYGNSASVIPCEDGHISCDRLIARALYNLGFHDQPIGGIAGFPICNYLEAHGFRKGTSFADIEPGSIIVVINNAGSFHCFVAASYNPQTNVFVKYDEGSNARIRSQQPFVEPWAYSRLVAVYNFT